jgi:uncharacterized protein YfaT (DUF1175 family)
LVIRRWHWITASFALLFAGVVYGRLLLQPRKVGAIRVFPNSLVANGHDSAIISIELPEAVRPVVRLGSRNARLGRLSHNEGTWRVPVEAGVLPGVIAVEVTAPGREPSTVSIALELARTDRAHDGTPDFLRLDNTKDRDSFRRAFAFLAEAQYFQPAEARPAEIKDCAALIRYAYREALRLHNSVWARSTGLRLVAAFGSVEKFSYPYTPLGADLFRIREGAFTPKDLTDGTFAQFADAKTISRFNTHRVGHDLDRAMPGDLLFYRQTTGHTSFHSMIYLGRSSIEDDGQRYVVYHTGPTSADRGEIRRLSIRELMEYPQPEWRPIESNAAFLGVARWNVLREGVTDVEAP